MTGHQQAASGSRPEARPKKSRSSTRQGRVARVVDRSTESVERFHRAVASWPLDALERIDRLEKPVARVRKLQERSIATTYELIRGVNREVVQLVRDTSRETRARGQRGSAQRVRKPKPKKVVRPGSVAKAS